MIFMYKICKTEKSLKRQRELENGFLDYLETVSYFNTDVSKICRHLNIPRKTFYRYFDSKEDILHALIDHRLSDMDVFITNPENPSHISIRSDAAFFFTFWLNERRFLDILYRNHLRNVIMSRVCSREYSEKREYTYGGWNLDSKDHYVHDFLMSGIMSLMLQWHTDGFQKPIEELAALVETLYATPLKTQLHYE